MEQWNRIYQELTAKIYGFESVCASADRVVSLANVSTLHIHTHTYSHIMVTVAPRGCERGANKMCLIYLLICMWCGAVVVFALAYPIQMKFIVEFHFMGAANSYYQCEFKHLAHTHSIDENIITYCNTQWNEMQSTLKHLHMLNCQVLYANTNHIFYVQ